MGVMACPAPSQLKYSRGLCNVRTTGVVEPSDLVNQLTNDYS